MKITLTKAIKTPNGEQADFDLPDEATLGLFKGVKLPLSVDAATQRTEFNLDASAFIQFMANLLGLPPSYAEKMPLSQVSEVMKKALPLLPPELQSFIQTLKTTSAT